MRISHVIPAEPGWKAAFAEPEGGETVSRILGWAVAGDDDTEVVGLIVDPSTPSRVVGAPEAASPGGGEFSRYRYIAPEPAVVAAPAPQPAPPEPDDSADRLARGLLKRRR